MKNEIPKGWRELAPYEIIKDGDCYLYEGETFRESQCGSTIGKAYQSSAYESDWRGYKLFPRVVRKHQGFKVGDRVVVTDKTNDLKNSSQAEFIGMTGVIIHIRPSLSNSEKQSYFIDFGKPSSIGNECTNIRADFLALESEIFKPIEIPLNANHTAVVKENEVKVGCQIFSFETVENLYKAVQEVKKIK